jgi:hypothetical protein
VNELPTIVRTRVSRDKAISRNPCDVFRHKESQPIGGGSPLFNNVMEAQVDPCSRDGAASGSRKTAPSALSLEIWVEQRPTCFVARRGALIE